MVLEGGALADSQRAGLRPVQIAKEIAFPITGHAVAKDKIVHSAADVNRIQLDETMVGERSRQVGRRSIEENCAAVEAASIGR
jgi:hypothetical protein